MTKNFSQVELNFLKSKGINIKNLKTRWAWVNENLAVEFYRDFLIPYFKKVPTNNELDAHGFRGFRYAVGRIRKKMTEITKAAGYKPHFEVKYRDLSFEDLVELYIYKIYPELKEKLKLSKEQPPTQLQMETNGYRGFIDAIYKRGRNIPDLQKAAGFKPLKEFNYAGKSFVELVEMFLNEIYPDLRKKLKLPEGEHPKKEDIDKYYNGLLKALGRIGKTYNNLAKAAGFMPRMEHKYIEKSFEELVEMFKNEIYPALVKKLSLQKSVAPTRDQVEKNFRGFTNALTNMKKYYPELLRIAGFEPKYEQKYRDMNLKDLVEFFLEEIYPFVKTKLTEKGLNLGDKEAPTVKQIRKYGYGGFIQKLYKITSYNDLIEAVGLEPNVEYRYVDMDFKDLVDFFKTQIYPDVKSQIIIGENEAPSKLELCDLGYTGFFDAIYRTGKTYFQLVKEMGFIPRQSIGSELGTLNHKAINFLISDWVNQDKSPNIIYYIEVKLFDPVNEFRIDGFLINNKIIQNHITYNFKNWIYKQIDNLSQKKLLVGLIDKIIDKKFYLFDYSNAYFNRFNKVNLKMVASKIIKYRKNNLANLFLVGTKWPYHGLYIIKLPEYINYGIKKVHTANTILISHVLFAKLIGLDGSFLQNFKEIISCNQKDDLNNLFKIIEAYEKKEIRTHQTKDLTKFLKKSSNVQIKINSYLSELFNFYIDFTTLDKWRYSPY